MPFEARLIPTIATQSVQPRSGNNMTEQSPSGPDIATREEMTYVKDSADSNRRLQQQMEFNEMNEENRQDCNADTDASNDELTQVPPSRQARTPKRSNKSRSPMQEDDRNQSFRYPKHYRARPQHLNRWPQQWDQAHQEAMPLTRGEEYTTFGQERNVYHEPTYSERTLDRHFPTSHASLPIAYDNRDDSFHRIHPPQSWDPRFEDFSRSLPSGQNYSQQAWPPYSTNNAWFQQESGYEANQYIDPRLQQAAFTSPGHANHGQHIYQHRGGDHVDRRSSENATQRVVAQSATESRTSLTSITSPSDESAWSQLKQVHSADSSGTTGTKARHGDVATFDTKSRSEKPNSTALTLSPSASTAVDTTSPQHQSKLESVDSLSSLGSTQGALSPASFASTLDLMKFHSMSSDLMNGVPVTEGKAEADLKWEGKRSREERDDNNAEPKRIKELRRDASTEDKEPVAKKSRPNDRRSPDTNDDQLRPLSSLSLTSGDSLDTHSPTQASTATAVLAKTQSESSDDNVRKSLSWDVHAQTTSTAANELSGNTSSHHYSTRHATSAKDQEATSRGRLKSPPKTHYDLPPRPSEPRHRYFDSHYRARADSKDSAESSLQQNTAPPSMQESQGPYPPCTSFSWGSTPSVASQRIQPLRRSPRRTPGASARPAPQTPYLYNDIRPPPSQMVRAKGSVPPPEFMAPQSPNLAKRPAQSSYLISNPARADITYVKHAPAGDGVYSWTKDEDARLTELVRKYPAPQDWDLIAKEHGKGKTSRDCHERWIRYLKPGDRIGRWSAQEDAIIIEAVTSSPHQPFTRWSDLAQRLPGRVGKQIRDRWVNQLDPNINHLPFSREDDLLLWEGHKKLGKRWVEISTKFFNSTRSENHIKNRWYSATYKKFIMKEFGPDAYSGRSKNKSTFTRDEDVTLWEAHKTLGNKWAEINKRFFNSARTGNELKNRWFSRPFKKFVATKYGPDAYSEAHEASKGIKANPK